MSDFLKIRFLPPDSSRRIYKMQSGFIYGYIFPMKVFIKKYLHCTYIHDVVNKITSITNVENVNIYE